MTDPYRTPGREVTDADRAETNSPPLSRCSLHPSARFLPDVGCQECLAPPRRPMTERMIAAHKEAHYRSRGCRYELCFVLSNAAAADFDLEHVSYADMYEREISRCPSDPDVTIRSRKGCRYVGSLRGVPVFVDPEMLGGWTTDFKVLS